MCMSPSCPVWKSRFYGAFVLNRIVILHAVDATPARWRGDAGSSPLDGARTAASSSRNDLLKNCRVHPSHWLISTQVLPLFIVVCLLSAATRSAFDAMQGDVDGDGKVDERDKALAASGYDDATAKVAPEK